ncbi:helix-turn-helix domain-containing protein [Taibaiella lutea]|nr:helix-turn-helix domain-containing protein [Taibaiella lutea]
MTKALYPTFDINNLDANKLSDEMLNVDHFKIYLSKNPHLKVVHKHSFYHLVYFTEGSGSHTIDFESFPVKKGMIYFMRPGQVHQWNFKGNVDGFIINFSPLFISRYLHAGIMEQFSFFNGYATDQVKVLDAIHRKEAEALFEAILKEKELELRQSPLMIASLLIQLFIAVQRSVADAKPEIARPNYNTTILRSFQSLIEKHFLELKLPKDYAALLHVTPSQLNAICKEQLDVSAGELIRNRIILEAKRLLVNFELSVNFIALELNFPDASYFVKFFKKYVGSTPDVFRKQQFNNG